MSATSSQIWPAATQQMLPLRSSAALSSPKLTPQIKGPRYRYYAGFSVDFVRDFLDSHDVGPATVILDPWNGSGTTTLVASQKQIRSIGVDLNPVMALIAKGRLADRRSQERLDDILTDFQTRAPKNPRSKTGDPLTQWFDGPTSGRIRELLRRASPAFHDRLGAIDHITAVEAHVVTGLFIVVRSILAERQIGTNPTWVKAPKGTERISVHWRELVSKLVSTLDSMPVSGDPIVGESEFVVGSTMSLPKLSATPNFVLTSPPYCTRIDYAVATRPELAVLGMSLSEQDVLRRAMLGTTTVPKTIALSPSSIGNTAATALAMVSEHPSKASRGYYWKWLSQYFIGYAESMRRISQAMNGGTLGLVVQDSYYKDIHIDLPKITIELAELCGWSHVETTEFFVPKTMAAMNTRSRTYRSGYSAVEAVLTFTRQSGKWSA